MSPFAMTAPTSYAMIATRSAASFWLISGWEAAASTVSTIIAH